MCGDLYFFFSSRRRHTRFDCDWSSDVCSSDLDALREREREAAARESTLGRREQKLALLEAELRTSAIALRDLEAEVRTRETRLVALRDYAILMQRTFRQTKLKSQSAPESDPTTATPAKTSSAPPQ